MDKIVAWALSDAPIADGAYLEADAAAGACGEVLLAGEPVDLVGSALGGLLQGVRGALADARA